MTEIITLDHITKRYGGRTVLRGICHTICRGDALAFVGHNGCGKSTILKVIAKLVRPTAGKVIYHSPLLFHYIPEKFPPVSLSAREYLLRMGALSGMRQDEAVHRIRMLSEDFFLEELLDSPMQSLSKGTLQKVGVIQAILKRPDVLLLDEPLSGQDAASQSVFIKKVNQLQEEGVTVFLAAHELKLVHAVAQKAYTIKDGLLAVYVPQETPFYRVLLEGNGTEKEPEGMTRQGRYHKLRLAEAECDGLLPKLLSQGWKIRGMEREDT